MTSRRGRVSATIFNNKIYVYGGSNGQKELNTGECFSLKVRDKWSMIKQISTPVAHSGKYRKNSTQSIYLVFLFQQCVVMILMCT